MKVPSATTPESVRQITLLLAALVLAAGCSPSAERPSLEPPAAVAPEDDNGLRMNHVQTLGSHNSYKKDIDPSLKLVLRARMPGGIDGLEYDHASLTEQLNLGLRKLELDVFHDPEGGRYANPLGIGEVADRGLPPGPAFDSDGVMRDRGFKVLHVQDIDFRTTCLRLADCLTEISEWSDANPSHIPIVITVNAKDGNIDWPGFVTPLRFDAAAFDALDAEIVDLLGRDRLLTPDNVRGQFESLERAILDRGWPPLDDVRGRILFVLDEGGDKRDAYLQDHPSLRGRVMFVNAPEGHPEAAFRIVNDPIEDGSYIRSLVEAGYLVRTRSDADTREAREGSYGRLDAAIASGAHFISTDYYRPDTLFGANFHVQLPGGLAIRCNPVTTDPDCRNADIEE